MIDWLRLAIMGIASPVLFSKCILPHPLWALLRTSYFVFRTSYFSFVSRPFMFPSPRSARPAYLSLTKYAWWTHLLGHGLGKACHINASSSICDSKSNTILHNSTNVQRGIGWVHELLYIWHPWAIWRPLPLLSFRTVVGLNAVQHWPHRAQK